MIEIITGPMFCGKTEELIRKIRKEFISERKVQLFKPAIDTRYSDTRISTHNGSTIEAIPVRSSKEVQEKIKQNTEVIGIDEIQFLDDKIIDLAIKLHNSEKRVLLACLNMDFRGEPFKFKDSEKHVGYLMALANHVITLSAICTHKEDGKICGSQAFYTQRLINGKPASYDSPLIMIGSKDKYEARCKKHHIISKPI